jgi:hypothetical protein
MTLALVVAIVWVVAVPLVVFATAELGWRIGEWRRAARRTDPARVVPFPGRRPAASSARQAGAAPAGLH